jgi:DNA-binding transcriptional ArsR family regulator
MTQRPGSRQAWVDKLAALASLGDETRRRLFEHVRSSPAPVGRDEAAAALDLPRSTASFHLDRLVRDGLLAAEFRKLGGRAGPGSGRPAKLYRPALDEVGVSVPERSYDLAGELIKDPGQRPAHESEHGRFALGFPFGDRTKSRCACLSGVVLRPMPVFFSQHANLVLVLHSAQDFHPSHTNLVG